MLIRARAKADIYNLYRRFAFDIAHSVIPLRASKTGKNLVVAIYGLLMTRIPSLPGSDDPKEALHPRAYKDRCDAETGAQYFARV